VRVEPHVKQPNEQRYRPMLATLADQPFDSEEWVYETKWDGFRLIAEVKHDSVRLYSRNGIEVTARYTANLRRTRQRSANRRHCHRFAGT
jgi:ATP-dependent DNA ligase